MDIKARYWQFIGYPDSLKKDFIEILESTGLGVSISPLHDKDLKANQLDVDDDHNNEYGVYKKPHYHFLLCWKNPTTFKNALSVVQSVNGVRMQKVENPTGAYWYQIHRFNSDKALYNDSDRILLNGLDESDFEYTTESIQYEIKCFVRELIFKNQLIRIEQLFNANLEYFNQCVDKDDNVVSELNFGFIDVDKFIMNNLFYCKTLCDDVYRKVQYNKSKDKDKD